MKNSNERRSRQRRIQRALKKDADKGEIQRLGVQLNQVMKRFGVRAHGFDLCQHHSDSLFRLQHTFARPTNFKPSKTSYEVSRRARSHRKREVNASSCLRNCLLTTNTLPRTLGSSSPHPQCPPRLADCGSWMYCWHASCNP